MCDNKWLTETREMRYQLNQMTNEEIVAFAVSLTPEEKHEFREHLRDINRLELMETRPDLDWMDIENIVNAEPYEVKYHGYSGRCMDLWKYNLPPTHPFSFWHDEKKCGYCGAEADCNDHIIPYAKGGAHLVREFPSVDNTTPACWECNSKKGAQLGWVTMDNRFGFYWDGTPGYAEEPPPMPKRAKKR